MITHRHVGSGQLVLLRASSYPVFTKYPNAEKKCNLRLSDRLSGFACQKAKCRHTNCWGNFSHDIRHTAAFDSNTRYLSLCGHMSLNCSQTLSLFTFLFLCFILSTEARRLPDSSGQCVLARVLEVFFSPL